MPSSIKAQSRLGIAVESTWGTGPTGNFNTIEVDAGEWLHETVSEYRDEMVRNVLARDFGSLPTVRFAEGTIGGQFLPIMTGYFLDSVFGGTETVSTLRDTAGTGDTTMDVHEFTVGVNPRSMSVQQSDNIADELFFGMMVNTFTLRFTTGEGPVEWEAEMIGMGKVYPATPRTLVAYPSIVAVPPRPLIGSMASVDINASVVARVLDFELVISREIELAYGAANTRVPNIRRPDTPRITFRATVELQLESDIQKYTSDAGDTGTPTTFNESTATYFDSNFDTWHVRIATDPDIDTATTPLPTTAPTSGNLDGNIGDQLGISPDTDQAVLDVYLDRVSYAESPIIIDRSEKTATFEFNGVALYDSGDSRLGVFRLMNSKLTAYTDNDDTP